MYDDNFYDTIREGIRSSAAALVPILIDLFPGTLSMIDVGCGEGWWCREFRNQGVKNVVGIDGSVAEHTIIDDVPFDGVTSFVRADLAGSLPDHLGRFDMAICLEVAEHLPPERADSFIDELCALSDVVVFSAAIPGQTGTDHIHLQYQSWWATKFNERGYWVSGELRRLIWNDDRIEPWYRQNVLVAAAHSVRPPTLICGGGVLDLVHPRIWEWKL